MRAPLFIPALVAVSFAAQAGPPAGYPFVGYDEGMAAARASGKHVFLYFGREGCGWCEKVNKETFPDPRVRNRYLAHYVLIYADSESGRRLTLPSGERITERELGVRFRAFATPMFVFLEPDGTPILKVAGIQTVGDMLDYDRFVHGGLYKTRSFRRFLEDRPR